MTAPDLKHVSLLWAAPERAADIAAMHERLFDPAWTEDSIVQLLDSPAATSFIAQLATPRVSVGFILGQVAADEAEILSLGVAPELQRRGIGRQLVNGLARAAQRAGAKRLFLEVAADNSAAIGLYRALGFAEVSRRAGYYERKAGPAADALVLQLAL
jgi:ribosomal-protein-alanine N-acetyltransferase